MSNLRLRVFKKQSTFKGAGENDVWYSATLSTGESAVIKFNCEIPFNLAAFEISNVKGSAKKKEVVKEGIKYTNYTYYVTSCEFHEIEGEELPL